MRRATLLFASLLGHASADADACHLVETIPVKNYSLPLIEGTTNTWEQLIALTDSASKTLDVTVMYWDELDESKQWEALGSERGGKVMDALDRAAARGVRLRFVNTARGQLSYNHLDQVDRLVEKYGADTVQLRYWNSTAWYGNGIMHQKVWVADSTSFYLGSANQDWKSLSQVQELGVFCAGDSASDVQNYFDSWWDFAGIDDASPYLRTYFSSQAGKQIMTPCWQRGVPEDQRCDSPLPSRPATSKANPGRLPNGQFYVSAAPLAVANERTFDLDALLDTVNSAKSTVKLSVMSANTCRSMKYGACTGSFEVRLYEIPGWQDQTVEFPDHTRVNHAKFAVSDNTLNVGTSNWDWGYFFETAGTSFHTDEPDLVATGNAIFDRNWDSSYSKPFAGPQKAELDVVIV